MKSIKELISTASFSINKATKHELSTSYIEARVIFCYVASISHETLIRKYDENISTEIEKSYLSLIKRRINLEPIAYIISSQEFYSRNFFVNQNVLIPRSDTELIIDITLQEIKIKQVKENAERRFDILEMGTGSGAIIISVLLKLANQSLVKSYKFTATDISHLALEVAKHNANLHNIKDKISFIHSDWFEQFEQKYNKFDIIISNPPYIDINDKDISDEVAKSEPHIALYAKDNGMAAYNIIVEGATIFLKNNGLLIFEIGYKQALMIKDKLISANFTNINIYQDIEGRDRVITAEKK
ncbi:MAG TPA: peptide chain release factor N(5)-glutamine methyltransferase [Candidatus Megaira endosymbiont of Hartmannula sinica]|nr:peptide chain release factor N(5)-glutamine methyltransferase [Candidatus Megaera endosymbiont of Hartmannula sinica]